MVNTQKKSELRQQHTSLLQNSPRKPYVPGVRKPFVLPDQKIELPAPEPAPRDPPEFNWLTLLTPLLTMVASLAMRMTMFRSGGSDWILVIMVTASVIHPITNIIGVISKRKTYKTELEERDRAYQITMAEMHEHLNGVAQNQFNTLHEAYPPVQTLRKIALGKGKYPRLWYRRLGVDSDFMSLRAGVYKGPPSFSISIPRFNDQSDPLFAYAQNVRQSFSEIPNLPFLISFDNVGSLGISCQHDEIMYSTVRRLLLDVLVHHSPDDLQLFLISDRPSFAENWDWLKWAPHTGALTPEVDLKRTVSNKKDINTLMRWFVEEHENRLKIDLKSSAGGGEIPSLLLIIDDRGKVRQMPELTRIVKWGHESRIYTLFICEENLPQIRARLDISIQGAFHYIETWEGGQTVDGLIETADRKTSLEVSRALASLETLGGKVTTPLPESIPLSQSIDNLYFNCESIENNWRTDYSDSELLQFPIGVHVNPDGLASLMINLLPAERGGFDAYHSILIGTTGSGKSEFMKSLVLGAAYHYSPDELNFFFMDFKGGAAFDIFKGLPHVTGVVTNLQPELVDRGLVAISSEISRRQERFADAKVRDIWAYNQEQNGNSMPHLWLLLDEFAKGLADFPELKEVLDLLVRQGRSLGMYLLLANQDVSSAVDKLLSNVGWRIALKVARRDELSNILEDKCPPTVRPGHGYLRTLNGEILEFQSGYAGVQAPNAAGFGMPGFEIYVIGADGRSDGEPIYSFSPDKDIPSPLDTEPKSEQDALVSLMLQAANNMNIEGAHPIYLDPMESLIPLDTVIRKSQNHRVFHEDNWSDIQHLRRYLHAPVGFIDFVEQGIQIPLQIDLKEKDGHLWIIGAPGSGKEMTITTILMSLAATHTPEEVHFYVLDCGSGSLLGLADLPHTGAVIRPTENERMLRLLDFIENELEDRKISWISSENGGNGSLLDQKPHIFLIINNFSELRTEYMDIVDRVSAFIQGNKVGIHMIFVTNLVRDVPTKISNNIARKIVLQMASRDELTGLINRRVAPMSIKAQGRGYWIDEVTAECQIAQSEISIREGQVDNWRTVMNQMKNSWTGSLPQPIKILKDSISLSELIARIQPQDTERAFLPIGISYHDLTPVSEYLDEVSSEWVVLGETKSGKSNFLISVAESLLELEPENWQIKALALRPSPLRKLNDHINHAQVYSQFEEAIKAFENLIELLNQTPIMSKKLLLLIDDLGAVFESGNTELDKLLNTIGMALKSRAIVDYYVLISGILNEFRPKAGSNALVRSISQNKTGICLSQDMQNWSWIGVTPQDIRPYQKKDLPPGRGYYINRGKPTFIQTAWVEKYHK